MSETIDTTKPKRPAHISRSLWRQIWQQPASHFPEQRPEHIPLGLWWPIADSRTSPKKQEELLLEVELDLSESRAIKRRAEIMTCIHDGAKPLDIFAEYRQSGSGEAALEGEIGPNWRQFLSPVPPINVYNQDINN